MGVVLCISLASSTGNKANISSHKESLLCRSSIFFLRVMLQDFDVLCTCTCILTVFVRYGASGLYLRASDCDILISAYNE